jgi:hypothetical protein
MRLHTIRPKQNLELPKRYGLLLLSTASLNATWENGTSMTIFCFRLQMRSYSLAQMILQEEM